MATDRQNSGHLPIRIGVVAPGRALSEEIATRVGAVLAEPAYAGTIELEYHPACFASHGHFAGPDAVRADALVDMAHRSDLDAIWFGRGGYGAARLLDEVIGRLGEGARSKTFVGYSDGGNLLAALYRAGIGRPVHGPMPADILREQGEQAVRRVLDFFLAGGRAPGQGQPRAAFNLMTLSHLCGTPHMPDLSGHVLMLEEVSEHHYRIDRALFTVFSQPWARQLSGVEIGRFSDIPENDIDFAQSVGAMVAHWAGLAGVPVLGTCDIGHDVGNAIIPFGASLLT